MPKALVIRLGAIGDMFMMMPVLKQLKRDGYQDLDSGDRVEPIELAPNSPRIAETYFTYALALSKLGRCGEVLQVAQLVQSRIPTDEISIANVGEAVAACGATVNAEPSPSPDTNGGTPQAGATVAPASTPTP